MTSDGHEPPTSDHGGDEATGGPESGSARHDERAHEQVGGLAEEAVRLAGAFAVWAGQQGADLGHHVHDVADGVQHGVRDAFHELDDHLATGSTECTVCPVCRTVSLVREVSPEVKAHLGAAAGSLLQAASGILAGVAAATSAASRSTDGPTDGPTDDDRGNAAPEEHRRPSTSSRRGARAPGVETIDLDAPDQPGPDALGDGDLGTDDRPERP